mgnify:CR=1 FL=1
MDNQTETAPEVGQCHNEHCPLPDRLYVKHDPLQLYCSAQCRSATASRVHYHKMKEELKAYREMIEKETKDE